MLSSCTCILIVCLLTKLSEASQSSYRTLDTDTLDYLQKLGYYQDNESNENVPEKARDVGRQPLNYLQIRFDNKDKAEKLPKDDRIRNALVDFQKFAGLRVSGVVDQETRNLMNTPRCGVEDVVGKRRKRFTLQGSRWWKKVPSFISGIRPKKLKGLSPLAVAVIESFGPFLLGEKIIINRYVRMDQIGPIELRHFFFDHSVKAFALKM